MRTSQMAATVTDWTATDDGYTFTFLSFGRRGFAGQPVTPFVYLYQGGYDRTRDSAWYASGTLGASSAQLTGMTAGSVDLTIPVEVCSFEPDFTSTCTLDRRSVVADVTAHGTVRSDVERFVYAFGGFREAVTVTGVRRDATATLAVDGHPLAGEQSAVIGREAMLDHVLDRPARSAVSSGSDAATG